ncbi:MAG: type II secretion system F family protein [Acidimicrobiia bacterium]
MTGPLVLNAVLLAAGTVLVLGDLRWFRRRPLVDRLGPYSPGGQATTGAGTTALGRSWRAVLGPWARQVGGQLASFLGVEEDLSVRLRRLHAPVDATTFRLRQLGWALGGLVGGSVVAAAARPPLALGLLFSGGGALLAFLLVEHRLGEASREHQRRLLHELPVVAEQLGMLLGAGFSLGAALNRLARRGSGVCAGELRIVCGRMRQGLDETAALQEWAAIARVPALDRIVSVLSLNRQAGDLSRLISDEARAIRRDVHRSLLEQIERRAQQVWIPVTVATLVPGAILLAIPFTEALRLFAET